MDTLFKADLFFFITALAVLFVTSLLVVALIYTIKILHDVRHVARRAREESDELFSDLADLRVFLRDRGERASALEDLVKGIMGFLPKRKRKAKPKPDKEKTKDA